MPHLPDHQTDHDPLLIAAFAAGDAEGADLERAQALVAACDDCAALHHDLRAIAAALPAVPAPARSRDFRLSREQADALRPSGWRRLLAPLAGPRFAFAGPLGGSLAALGLVGILVAGAASSPIAGSGAGGQGERDAGAASVEPGAEALSGPASEQPSSGDAYLAAPAACFAGAGVVPERRRRREARPARGRAASQDTRPAFGGAAPVANQDIPSAAADAGPVDATSAPPAVSSGLSPVIPIVSALLLLAGLALLALGLVRRRVGRATG